MRRRRMPQGFGALQRMKQAGAPQPDRDQNSFGTPQALRRRQSPMPNTGAAMGGVGGNRQGIGAITPGNNNLTAPDANRYASSPWTGQVPTAPPSGGAPKPPPVIPGDSNPMRPGIQGPGAAPAPVQPPPKAAPNPGMFATHPQYEQGMRGLEDQLAAELAAAGVDEANIKAMLELTKSRIGVNRAEGLRRNDESANERGIYNSGIRLRDAGYVNYDYDQQTQNADLEGMQKMSDIARRKSGAQSLYSQGIADLLSQVGGLMAQDPYAPVATDGGDAGTKTGTKKKRPKKKSGKKKKRNN